MIEPDMQRTPALVARARRECFATQKALARAVRVSLRTLSRWENGRQWPSPAEARRVALALSGASGETWRALVDALRLPLDEMLAACPEQRASAAAAPAPASPGAPASRAIVPVHAAEPPLALRASLDLQGAVDDLIRAYAEEVDVSPRRLRLALGMLLGELRLFGVSLDEGQALVMRMPRRMR